MRKLQKKKKENKKWRLEEQSKWKVKNKRMKHMWSR